MDKIDRMRAFALVAKNASFTLAAQRMGRSSRLVSKYVADLEEALGVQLLNRTTRSVSLTDAGATYLAMCEPLLDGFDELEETVRNAQKSLRGVIRISAPTGFGSVRLAPFTVTALLSACRRKRREPAVYGNNRQAVPGNTVVRITPNGALHAAQQPQMREVPCPTINAPYAFGSDLSGAEHQQEASAA